MKNKVGSVLFGTGLIGALLFGSGMDSPGNGWIIALGCMAAFAIIAALGYFIMDPTDFSMYKEDYEDARQRKTTNKKIG